LKIVCIIGERVYMGERGRMRELVAVNRGGVERVWGIKFSPPRNHASADKGEVKKRIGE
jgi:hypothetical protein